MKYKNFIILFILISFSLINVGRAEIPPNNIQLKYENRPWSATTQIIIPLNDTTQNEVIQYYHLPNHSSVTITNTTGNQVGRLTSDIEFYIDNEKQNFNEFYLIANDNGKFRIIQKKDITFNKSTELKLKFNKILSPNILYFDKNITTFKFNTIFDLDPNSLFVQFVFRVPAANAQNIKLNFINSVLNDSNNNIMSVTSAPVSEVYATNKYLEISYLFWNEGLRRQVVSDEERDSIGLRPNTKYHFQNIFSIEYDTINWDWILQSMIVAIFLTFVFYGGRRWERKIRKNNLEKVKTPK